MAAGMRDLAVSYLLHGGRDEDVALLEEQVLPLVGHGPGEALDCPMLDLDGRRAPENSKFTLPTLELSIPMIPLSVPEKKSNSYIYIFAVAMLQC